MINSSNITDILKNGLENIKLLSERKNNIRVKRILIVNEDTLCCEFISYASNSIDIKLEIAEIMGFFNGFFRDNAFPEIKLNYYAVRVFDEQINEILYAISSKKAAELVGKNGSIEWLKATVFQENTDDYRLMQAKKIIYEIENCLREIVKIKLKEKFGQDWWNIALGNKLGNSVKETYFNQFGVSTNDGDTLIAYTFTLQLKKIVSTHFNIFKNYFLSLTDFGSLLDDLNKIRRVEAHNRIVSKEDLNKLEELHANIISKILLDLTSFQSVYLTENWRLKIRKIMLEREYKAIYSNQDIIDEHDIAEKINKFKTNINSLIIYLDATIYKLKSIVTPVHKRQTHVKLINSFEEYKKLQQSMIEKINNLDNEGMQSIAKQISSYEKEMDAFSKDFLLAEG